MLQSLLRLGRRGRRLGRARRLLLLLLVRWWWLLLMLRLLLLLLMLERRRLSRRRAGRVGMVGNLRGYVVRGAGSCRSRSGCGGSRVGSGGRSSLRIGVMVVVLVVVVHPVRWLLLSWSIYIRVRMYLLGLLLLLVGNELLSLVVEVEVADAWKTLLLVLVVYVGVIELGHGGDRDLKLGGVPKTSLGAREGGKKEME